MPDSLTASFPPGKLEEFKGLFHSKKEMNEIGKDLKEEAVGWKGRVKAQAQLASVPAVKDPALLEDLHHRLASHNMDSERTRFSGGYTSSDDGTVTLLLRVRCKQPSLMYRLLFDEFVDVPLRIDCYENESGTELRVEQAQRRTFDAVGCLITMVLFAAFVIPGVVWLYITRTARNVWNVVQQDVVFAALRERLAQL